MIFKQSFFYTSFNSNFLLQTRKINNNSLDLNKNTLIKAKYAWLNYSSSQNNIITVDVLRKELQNFFKFFINEYKDIEYFAIIFKIAFTNNDVRSCSTTQVANIDGFNSLYSIFSNIFFVENFAEKVSEDENLFNDDNTFEGRIIFTFKPLLNINNTKYEDYTLRKDTDKIIKKDSADYIKDFNYKDYHIPATMDLWKWPNIVFSNNYRNAFASIKIKKSGDKPYIINFNIIINDSSTFINVSNEGTHLFSIYDSLNNTYDLTDFKRVIKDNMVKKYYYFFDGKVKLYHSIIDTKFIKSIHKDCEFDSDKFKVLTLDFETRDISYTNMDNPDYFAKKIPVAVSIFDGKTNYSCIFKNENTWQVELATFLKINLLRRKFEYHKIYVHNFSYFDAIFLIDTLTQLGSIRKPVIRDNKILKIRFNFKINETDKRKYTLTFYDSNLLFQSSLRNLSKSFKVETPKTYFPFNFMNQQEGEKFFDYKGKVPSIKFFPKNLSEKEYELYCSKYPNNFWNFNSELLKYCEIDTIALHQILYKFYIEIYNLFGVDITKYPTLASLTFAIYRANFMQGANIPIILGKLHKTLKQSYYGGITETYLTSGRDIKSYDVNSLYPFSMRNFEMPVGKIVYFSGDINLLYNKIPFGFFRVKIKAPLDILRPALPKKFKIPSINSLRTIFPVGEWEGWYFGEELKDKLQQGYTFIIEEGYLFEKKNIFKNYIDVLYKMKSDHSSDDPKYFIAKLLMNSLYGRFGLNPEVQEVDIISEAESEEIITTKKNVLLTPLLSGNVIVSYDRNDDILNIDNISVSIASAIAAYSRIVMNKYLIKYNENIYYIDTDGIKINRCLDDCYIDNKALGKMKYEYTYLEAAFPLPKVYGGRLLEPYKNYDKELVKIKGLKNPIKYRTLDKTLIMSNFGRNSLILNQEKWIRKMSESTILVKYEDYTLELNESKRELLYNVWGDLVATLPFVIENGGIKKRGRFSGFYRHLIEQFHPL